MDKRFSKIFLITVSLAMILIIFSLNFIIDDNLDAITTERTKYQNKILNTQGLIGRIEAAINSLVTKIENWFN